tara:strand:+ start:317 stop:508 length:192 start_codon:yes stop_codon:yes gene_type:complete
MDKKGKWKIEKIWDYFCPHKYEEGWSYVAGYHIEDDVIYEDHFGTEKEAKLYIEKMKKGNTHG